MQTILMSPNVTKEEIRSEIGGYMSRIELPRGPKMKLANLTSKIMNMSLSVSTGLPDERWKVIIGNTPLDAINESMIALREVTAKGIPYDTIKIDAWDTADRISHVDRFRPIAMGKAEDMVRTAVVYSAGTLMKKIWVDAAEDAILLAKLISVSDQTFVKKDEYLKHAKERMDAWLRGYHVVAEVKGQIWVWSTRQDICIRKETSY